ncbi:uncharacterized protein I303_104285 [Kwoniella dejecticola CBS 10117]|uniref:Uncharacterized protein n=1 Tax=Kwoniella dejecticola CBS 10117 TaxID=1296121 RepID=A0A1A6A5R8_9TREE|nr:uncharacterized protein I303_04738 [Kwoniella dejecticola CBS 10117]OBR85403.1 hypothetical protein I303_04738 [Kwoniella dejecticola CBS 10117]
MSVATATASHVPGWKPLECQVTRGTADTVNSAVRGATADTRWVTDGATQQGEHYDKDLGLNTEYNNRVRDDGYDGDWGSGRPISTRIGLGNIKEFLLGPDKDRCENLREKVQSLVDKTNSYFEVELPSIASKVYSEAGPEIEIRRALKYGGIEKAQKLRQTAYDQGKPVAEAWLKGELSDVQQVDLNILTMGKFLSNHPDSAKDSAVRRQVQKFCLGEPSVSVNMSYADSVKLNEDLKSINREAGEVKSEGGDEGIMKWQMSKQTKLAEMAQKWASDSGLSETDWQSELKITKANMKARAKNKKAKLQAEQRKKLGLSDTETILSTSNIDAFLETQTDLAKDSKTLESVFRVLTGQGSAKVDVKSGEAMKKLQESIDATESTISEFEDETDQSKVAEKVKAWQANRQKKVKELVASWEKQSGKAIKDWMARDTVSTDSSSGGGRSERRDTQANISIANLDTFMTEFSGLAKDPSAQAAVLRALKGEATTINFTSTRAATALNESSIKFRKAMKAFEDSKDEEGCKSWQMKRMKGIGQALAQWEKISGKSRKEWSTEVSSSNRPSRGGSSSDSGSSGGTATKATIRSSNIDAFLSSHSSLARDPSVLEAVSSVLRGGGHREVDVGSAAAASKLAEAATHTQKTAQAMQSKGKEAFEKWSRDRQSRIQKYLSAWSSIANKSESTSSPGQSGESSQRGSWGGSQGSSGSGSLGSSRSGRTSEPRT